jgi:hypothetical protein
MDERMSFEARLSDAFGRYADLAPVTADPSIAQRAIAFGRRRDLGSLWPSGRRTLVWVGVALALLLALAGALLVGSLLQRHERLLGGFSEVGPSQIRFIEAAALLGDGRVVVFGEGRTGIDPAGPVTQVEVFDPNTKTFAPLATLSESRTGFTATALENGQLLLVGGYSTSAEGGATSTADVELLDPQTGAFTSTGSMAAARSVHTATLLADGRVLAIGGQTVVNGDSVALWSSEIYDPGTGSWSDAGSLATHRSLYSTTLLPDGRVLLAGGWDEEGNDLSSVEVFDPATGAFVAAGDMLGARRSPAAALLRDGRVLVVGGYVGNSVLSSAEIFDPTTGLSTATGSLRTERHDASALVLRDGRVVIAGGANLIGEPLSTEIYDPATGSFAPGASATYGHGGPGVALRDGRVLLTGAANEILDPQATTEVVTATPRSDRLFLLTGTPVTDRTAHAAIKLVDGRVLLVGGLASKGARGQAYSALGTAEIFDPRSGTFASTGPLPLPENSLGITGVPLADGRALLLVQKHRHRLGPEWALLTYDPVTGRFTTEGSIESTNEAESAVRLVELQDGGLLILGAPLMPPATPSADMYVYRVERPQIQAANIGVLPGCGTILEAVAASGDRIAVLCRDPASKISVFLFDLANRTSSRVEMGTSQGAAALVRLADGRLLVEAGSDDSNLTLLDPRSGRATPAGMVRTAPHDSSSWPETSGISMTVLADGRVLILSGREAGVWDPKTGTAAPVPGPAVSRDGHTATLLDDGRVLVFGGTPWPADNGALDPPAAELFDPAAIP